jgi:membrane-associated phospholipid phosphatase
VSTTFAGRRGARLALLAIAACLLGLVLTWVLAELVPITHFKDAVALYDLTRLNRPLVEVPGNLLLDLLYPPFFAAWSALLVLLALRSRRRALALAIVAILPLAPLSAELLKPLLAHAHDQVGATKYIGAASWPSGHATAAAVLAWCAVLVASPARRALVAALGAVFALAVGVALLVLAWHMPSDVVGGYLLATLWAAGAVAVLCALEARRARKRPAEQPARAGLRGVPGAVRAGSP